MKDLGVFNYGYVVNSHKVQGSTYEHVFVLEDNILTARNSKEQIQLMYTAFSRTKVKLYRYNPQLSIIPNQEDTSEIPPC